MKILISSLTVAFVLSLATSPLAFACNKITVKGMTCDSCREKVTEALKGSPKVDSVTVSLDDNTATITYKNPKDTLSEAELQKIIKEKAGFKAQKCLAG